MEPLVFLQNGDEGVIRRVSGSGKYAVFLRPWDLWKMLRFESFPESAGT